MCPLDKSTLCTVLSSFGITHYLRYYDGIRLPHYLLASFVCSVVCHTLPLCEESGAGLPSCLSHIVHHAWLFDPGASCFSSPSCVLTSLRHSFTELRVAFHLNHSVGSLVSILFVAQSLSSLMPDCLRLKRPIASSLPRLATGGLAIAFPGGGSTR